MEFKAIQELIANKIIYEKAYLEPSFDMVSNFSNKAFTLKPQYQNIYEPFIFSRDDGLLTEMQ